MKLKNFMKHNVFGNLNVVPSKKKYKTVFEVMYQQVVSLITHVVTIDRPCLINTMKKSKETILSVKSTEKLRELRLFTAT